MSTVQSAAGVVLDRGGVTILDSREMDWEESDYQLYARAKVLARDDDGDPIFVRRWCQVARVEPHGNKARGGYHTTREMMLCLSGTLPHWEMEPDPVDGLKQTDLVLFRPGWWLDRFPGSIHGMAGEPFAIVDSEWVNMYLASPDPFVGQRESVELTEAVPFTSRELVTQELSTPLPYGDDSDPAVAIQHNEPVPGGAVVIDTHRLPWNEHPLLPGWRQRTLAQRKNGDATVTVEFAPFGLFPAATLPHRVRHGYRDFMYVLDGEMWIREYESADDEVGTPILLKQGYALDHRPGSIYGFDPEDANTTGCYFLHFRTRDDAQFGKDADVHAVWSRAMTPGHKAVGTKGIAAKPYASEDERQAFMKELGEDYSG